MVARPRRLLPGRGGPRRERRAARRAGARVRTRERAQRPRRRRRRFRRPRLGGWGCLLVTWRPSVASASELPLPPFPFAIAPRCLRV
ncbi:hypothetical protein M885DRAFT_622261 [Pelagophyceae sp. CCMP2097]|nr:hypothetical protein M885DRAFT_622261 [Pelagophyceae sp. CCMP2097]